MHISTERECGATSRTSLRFRQMLHAFPRFNGGPVEPVGPPVGPPVAPAVAAALALAATLRAVLTRFGAFGPVAALDGPSPFGVELRSYSPKRSRSRSRSSAARSACSCESGVLERERVRVRGTTGCSAGGPAVGWYGGCFGCCG